MGVIYIVLNNKYKFLSSLPILFINNIDLHSIFIPFGFNNVNIWLSVIIILLLYIIIYYYIFTFILNFIMNIINLLDNYINLIFNPAFFNLTNINNFILNISCFIDFILYYYFLYFLFIL